MRITQLSDNHSFLLMGPLREWIPVHDWVLMNVNETDYTENWRGLMNDHDFVDLKLTFHYMQDAIAFKLAWM